MAKTASSSQQLARAATYQTRTAAALGPVLTYRARYPSRPEKVKNHLRVDPRRRRLGPKPRRRGAVCSRRSLDPGAQPPPQASGRGRNNAVGPARADFSFVGPLQPPHLRACRKHTAMSKRDEKYVTLSGAAHRGRDHPLHASSHRRWPAGNSVGQLASCARAPWRRSLPLFLLLLAERRNVPPDQSLAAGDARGLFGGADAPNKGRPASGIPAGITN